MAGSFEPALLDLVDDDGVTLGDALRDFGGAPDAVGGASRRGERLLGYCEVHIEQGPVLEGRDVPVGVVTAIAGPTRAELDVHGRAGHAGTVPMDARRDALRGGRVGAGGRGARRAPSRAGGDGRPAARRSPGRRNVVPGARRSPRSTSATPTTRCASAAVAALRAEARRIGAARGVEVGWREVRARRRSRCDPALTARAGRRRSPSAGCRCVDAAERRRPRRGGAAPR